MSVLGNEPSPTEISGTAKAELAEPEHVVDADKAAFTEAQIHEAERLFDVQAWTSLIWPDPKWSSRDYHLLRRADRTQTESC